MESSGNIWKVSISQIRKTPLKIIVYCESQKATITLIWFWHVDCVTTNQIHNKTTKKANKLTVSPSVEGCPIHPIRSGSPNWWRPVTVDHFATCQQIITYGTDGSNPWQFARSRGTWKKILFALWRGLKLSADRDDQWWMVTIRDSLSVCKRLG